MIAREKHSAVAEKKSATDGGNYFSAIINEKAFDEVKQEVRQHGLSSLENHRHKNPWNGESYERGKNIRLRGHMRRLSAEG